MSFFLFTGPTQFFLNMGTESFGYALTNFFRKIIRGATTLTPAASAGLSGLRGMFAFGGCLMMLITIAICASIVKIGVEILQREEPI